MSTAVKAALDRQLKVKVFISYSRKDLVFAEQLEAALRARGIEPLIDRSEVYAFEDWWKRIKILIAQADTVVFVLSPDAVASKVALKELAYATSLNKRFAPIICRQVDPDAVPEPLRRLNFIFFDDAARFDASTEVLTQALQTDINWIREHTIFGEASRRWTAASRSRGLLLRSPVLEEAERWIASRPENAPVPTVETQTFISESRRGATRRRNIFTASLAAGLTVALLLAGLAYWQRGIAVEQRGIALTERDKATRSFQLAQRTAESLVFDIAQGLRNVQGMSAESVRKILETAKATFEQLAASAPDDLTLQRSRGVMLNQFGGTYLVLGNLEQALEAYRDGLAIAERLGADGSNTERQRDLTVSYDGVGDVLARQGNLPAALQAYRDSLAIRERLAKAEPGNAGWQSDLSISYQRVGDVLRAQGNLAEALASYGQMIAHLKRPPPSDPKNAGWQHNLSVSYEKVGDVLRAQGNLAEALASYRQSLAIMERLAASDRNNTGWRRDLSVSHGELGNTLVAQGDLAEALAEYRAELAILDRLTSTDGSHTGWQRDKAVAHGNIGDVLIAQGNNRGAIESYQEKLSIVEQLSTRDPRNAGWQFDLAASHASIADAHVGEGELEEALSSYRRSHAILEQVAASGRTNAGWQLDLLLSNSRLTLFGDEPIKRWEFIVATLRQLNEEKRLTPEQQTWLPFAEQGLTAARGKQWQWDLLNMYWRTASLSGNPVRQARLVVTILRKLEQERKLTSRQVRWLRTAESQVAIMRR
jgi:tetratricopeptide (TPR) repeat protein